MLLVGSLENRCIGVLEMGVPGWRLGAELFGALENGCASCMSCDIIFFRADPSRPIL